ncbi:MAG: N-acetyl-gamma-glutamyl-phosphate reductase [Rikenellaceae bacterium]
MKKINVAIVGGAGYTGGEAIRLLIHHPNVDLRWVHSSSNGGNPLSAVHTDLLGDTDLCFASEMDWAEIDCAFLCVGHGDARKFLERTEVPMSVKIVDLSQDFRILGDTSIGEREFVYGLAEMNGEAISGAQNIANPGCFATCIQLALLPLAAEQKIEGDIHISAITGSTGAGQSLSATSHFSWRSDNMSVYKAFTHQHLREVRGMIAANGCVVPDVNFIPYRGDFTRGIIATCYTKFDGTLEEAYQMYEEYYKDAPFTHISRKNIALKQVVASNKALLYLEVHEGKLMIISIIDNLLKGASGQAVQNMNLMFGLDPRAGLGLKPTAF